jgi:hypothetical protein
MYKFQPSALYFIDITSFLTFLGMREMATLPDHVTILIFGSK